MFPQRFPESHQQLQQNLQQQHPPPYHAADSAHLPHPQYVQTVYQELPPSYPTAPHRGPVPHQQHPQYHQFQSQPPLPAATPLRQHHSSSNIAHLEQQQRLQQLQQLAQVQYLQNASGQIRTHEEHSGNDGRPSHARSTLSSEQSHHERQRQMYQQHQQQTLQQQELVPQSRIYNTSAQGRPSHQQAPSHPEQTVGGPIRSTRPLLLTPVRSSVQGPESRAHSPTPQPSRSLRCEPYPPPSMRVRQNRAPLSIAASAHHEHPAGQDAGSDTLGIQSHPIRSSSSQLPPTSPRPIPAAVAMSLPPHAPISVHKPPPNDDHDVDMMTGEDEDPIEVTLNIDIPKSSRPTMEGVPAMTALSVNPSWHCVFIESVQQQRIQTSIRIQFCPSPVSRTQSEHRLKVQRLKSLQVIGYESRLVEMTRRIYGANLLKRGGITVHLDPTVITFNDASYGFTISLTSFVTERLCRASGLSSKPDEPLPLTRQQNSAYCRRNLKEMYYDTFSKDVIITLRPTGDVLYVHSVVLENYGHFRSLLEHAVRESALQRAGDVHGDGSESAVDEEGYAQPIRPQDQQQQTQGRQGIGEHQRNRRKTRIEIEGIGANVFRAVLHYMYIGHVPTALSSSSSSSVSRPLQQSTTNAATMANAAAGSDPSFSSSAESSHNNQAPVSDCRGSRQPPTNVASSSSSTTAEVASASQTTVPVHQNPYEFSWRELYEAATRFQLSGLIHLSKVCLICRLDTKLAVKELFEWAYQYWELVPCYASFLIESLDVATLNIPEWRGNGIDGTGTDPDVAMQAETEMRMEAQLEEQVNLDAGTDMGMPQRRSILGPYRTRCPRFNEIMVVFLHILNERNKVETMV
ncbi:hypothetical protein BGZ50_005144 [Haplosporangium sp. Z 11]|nr:hypothetical protein BGZ50_005144 [Haplosporangium sp. Z 11]